ncbi:hypothetical protein MSAN_02326100 [Mycena sanguinolenta]|uniref:JmjC domain-containing protein n=1 Tax=Mycena sanguinolenta TaxID=230812 RepID=A0A8H7CGW1_9AGAR|nr:hypothetical protein MSAN_02326100 [Mycena sanguinolenta]
MAECKLTDTPLFQQTCWLSQAFIDGTWADLSPSALGSYAQFWAALKQMNLIAVPSRNALNMDATDFRIAVRLDSPPSGWHIPKQYNNGRAMAWACLLHFQVLDLILASDFPHLTKPAAVTPVPCTFKNPSSARRLIDPLCQWTMHIQTLKEELETKPSPSLDAPTLQPKSTVDSFAPVLAFSQIEGQTLKAKTMKNLQAMAAGLVWILELGSETAPLLNEAGQLAISPLTPISSRYTSFNMRSGRVPIPDLDNAMKHLKTTPAQLLHALSYSLNVSSALLFCNLDLSVMHIDLDVEQEIAHSILAAGSKPKALSYIEQCVHLLARGSSGTFSAESIAVKNLALIPGIKERYREHRYPSNTAAAVAPNLCSSAVLRSTASYEGLLLISPHLDGRIARALSQPPQMRTLPDAEPEMVLISELASTTPPADQAAPIKSSSDDQCPPASPEQGTLRPAVFDSHEIPDSIESTVSALKPSSKLDFNSSTSNEDSAVTSASKGTSSASNDSSASVDDLTCVPENPVVGSILHMQPPALSVDIQMPPTFQDLPTIPDQPVVDPESDTAVPQDPESPLTSVNSAMDVDSPVSSLDLDDIPTEPQPGPRRSNRRNTNNDAPAQPNYNMKNTSTRGTSAKRKASGTTNRVPKKPKRSPVEQTNKATEIEEEFLPVGLDIYYQDPEQPGFLLDDLKHVLPIPRSHTSEAITALLPDGQTERVFHYLSHPNSQTSEYQLIWDVNTSMASHRNRCSKDGVLFTQYRAGVHLPAVTDDDSFLLCVKRTEWDAMADTERVALWATGRDIFVHDLTAGPRVTDIRAQMTKNHYIDSVVQVQVQGLRVSAAGDDQKAEVDHTDIIRRTTLRAMLDHANTRNGPVLNALNIASGHVIHPNPLLGSGFDLETMAYRQTSTLLGVRSPPYDELYWELLGLNHTLSLFHGDIAMTWVYVSGPGEKFWIRERTRGPDNFANSRAFDNWQPDKADPAHCDYEVIVLPAGGGILLQQAGRRHAVIGTDTGSVAGPKPTATLTVGGYFCCASGIRAAMSNSLHMVMMQHLLTNSEHVVMWQIFVRIAMFWLNVTADRPQDQDALAAYLPDLSLTSAHGWMDIIYLSCIIVLLPCLDHRNYNGDGVPNFEMVEADMVRAKYQG